MELTERIFTGTDPEGKSNDLSQEKFSIKINGKDEGITLEHLFRKYALNEDEGAIYGTSLLSYFKVDGGKLVDNEGHIVEFFTSDGKPFLITDNTEKPFIEDEAPIDLEYVKAFSEVIGINFPDVLFADLLSDEEKQYFINEREERNIKAQKAINEQKEKEAQDNAEKELLQKKQKEEQDKVEELERKKQAEAEIVAKISPDFIVDERKYKKLQKDYQDLLFKEYIDADGIVHFFYSPKWKEYAEDPFILVKRTDSILEDVETDVENIAEEGNIVQVEYVDGEERKKLTLNLENDTVSITEAETA